MINNYYLASMCRAHNKLNVLIISADTVAEYVSAENVARFLESHLDMNH